MPRSACVIVPTVNNPIELAITLDCLIEQDYSNLEIIVVGPEADSAKSIAHELGIRYIDDRGSKNRADACNVAINESESDPNLIFWFYECILLSYLGFKPNLDDNNLPGINLPDLDEGPNSRLILSSLLSEKIDQLPNDIITANDRKVISKYLWVLLCYHFEGLQNIKSFQVAREILSNQ